MRLQCIENYKARLPVMIPIRRRAKNRNTANVKDPCEERFHNCNRSCGKLSSVFLRSRINAAHVIEATNKRANGTMFIRTPVLRKL